MTVLAASVVTKNGKPLISRQFHASLSRSRLESLLISFTKLIQPGQQHTTCLSADKTIRFVYMPVDELYVILLTPPLSNILQDLETLHLVGRIVSETCSVAGGRGGATENEVLRNSFELLSSFDEVVSLGYRERVGISEVRAAMEMESHEERIQEIIARNKEQEAKEELKRRAKQLEMQRKEMLKRGQSPYTSAGSSMGMSNYERPAFTPTPPVQHLGDDRFGQPSLGTSKPLSGKGMKLGAKKSNTALLDMLGGEMPASPEVTPLLSQPAPEAVAPPSVPVQTITESPFAPVEPKDVHLSLREKLSVELNRDGGVNSLEIKGDLDLRISSSSAAKIVVRLSSAISEAVQFKTHPNVDKKGWSEEKKIGLKDPKRGFPAGQGLGVLKWRLASKDESLAPLSINCWPSQSDDGTCDVNIEYELASTATASLYNVTISIPLPEGQYPSITNADGTYTVNPDTHTLDWTIDIIEPGESTANGSLEFSIAGDDSLAFFPIAVDFAAQQSLCGISIASVTGAESGEAIDFSLEPLVQCENYDIV